MSRTRGGSEDPLNVYHTPEWVTRVLLDVVSFPGEGRILDAGCGEGAILKVLSEEISLERLAGIDLRQDCLDALRHPDLLLYQGDFLGHAGYYDHIVMNPPYGGRENTAHRFVEHALDLVPKGGLVCALLRLPWFASGEVRHGRASWLRANMPQKIYALERRPSFTGGGTDGTDYGWGVWRKGIHPLCAEFHIARCLEKEIPTTEKTP